MWTYLVLDQELDTLDGSSSGLGDGSGNTTHYRTNQYCENSIIPLRNPALSQIPRREMLYNLSISKGGDKRTQEVNDERWTIKHIVSIMVDLHRCGLCELGAKMEDLLDRECH